MKLTRYFLSGIAAVLMFASCSKDFLDTEYTNYLSAEEAGIAAAKNPDVFLNGMWSFMVEYQGYHDCFGLLSTVLSTDFMTEDIAMAASHWFSYDYELDNRMYNYRRPTQDWNLFYTLIAKANEIIGGFPNGAQTEAQRALLGQALAIRGMSYSYLIQIFQNPYDANTNIRKDAPGVPIILCLADGFTLDELDSFKGRNTVADVIDRAEKDLVAAVENLSQANFKRSSKNYVDLSVAYGFLARHYLMSQQWAKAAEAAQNAHKDYTIMDKNGLHDGFLTCNNVEWMWGFAHNTETQTAYASFSSHMANNGVGYAGLDYCAKLIDARLYNQIPDTDYRKELFNGPEGSTTQKTAAANRPYAALKFGHVSDWSAHYVYMRASEMVLIEAEALVRQNKSTEAATALKKLMEKRDPAWRKSSTTLDEILLQRRIELWGEGFGYFDLKRNSLGIDRNYAGNNHLPGYAKTVPAQSPLWTYQIPNQEMQENSHLDASDQNE